MNHELHHMFVSTQVTHTYKEMNYASPWISYVKWNDIENITWRKLS